LLVSNVFCIRPLGKSAASAPEPPANTSPSHSTRSMDLHIRLHHSLDHDKPEQPMARRRHVAIVIGPIPRCQHPRYLTPCAAPLGSRIDRFHWALLGYTGFHGIHWAKRRSLFAAGPLPRVPLMRNSYGWPITLAVVMIVLVVALLVGWIVLTVREVEQSA